MKSSSFTDFFIHRPIFAWVINIVVVLLGATAFFQLATRQYPVTESTTITLRTNLDASAKVMEKDVTKPLEDALSALQGLESMESETQKGESKIRLYLQNRSLDAAAADVREILSRVKTKLPEDAHPVVTKGDSNAAAVMELALTGGENTDLASVYHVGEHLLKSTLESVNGVATVEVSGGSDFQMNIILDPLRMASYQVMASDVTRALKSHNFQRSAGHIKEAEQEFSLTTQACLRTPKEFSEVVVTKHRDKLIRLSDIAQINICPEEEIVKVLYNGKPAISLSILPQANANPVDISKEVRNRVEQLQKSMPLGSKIHIALDKALFIQASIAQVYHALLESVVLVLLVILVFLRSYKASLIPLITIPISLVGTFFIMYLCGFTINVLSLLALVLAIGLVVDDAIVVLENIYRLIEMGKSPFQAAVLGTREVRFSIIAMTITLAAVYAPIAVAPGIIGKVFKEFALTLAGSVLLSGFTALTLSPAMCARLLRSHTPEKSGGLLEGVSKGIEGVLSSFERGYLRSVIWTLGHRTLIVVLGLCFFSFCGWWGWYGLKRELSPPVDEGSLFIKFYAPPSKNLAYLSKRGAMIDTLLQKQSYLSNRLLILQTIQESMAQTTLVPWKERKNTSCRDIVNDLHELLPDIRGLDGYPYCPTGSIIASRGSQYPLSFRILTSGSAEELQKVGRKIRRDLKAYPGVDILDTSETAQQSEYEIRVNRERINQLGIDPEEVGQTLQTLVRGVNVGRFEKNDKLYPVHIWINEKSRNSLESVSSLFVRGHDQNNRPLMVPLREILSFEQKQGDPFIERYNRKQSYAIKTSIKPGFNATQMYLDFAKHVEGEKMLPAGYTIEPAGELKKYFDEKGSTALVFGLALLFIFLVMAAQFESVRAPFIIILTVPLALGGAFISLGALKTGSINVYSQIGFVTLIGLITKHGILLVDFANRRREEGRSVNQAIVEACQLRLRPILMTTFAMVLGAIPLALATGAGAEGRQQIGVVIVGGMSLGTIFALFVLPVMYVILTRKSLSSKHEMPEIG